MSDKLPSWKELEMATAMTEPGSSTRQLTGQWRSKVPKRDDSKCHRCGICWIYCPDAALYLNKQGYYEVDLDHCKGCGICAFECWADAIVMIEEGE